VLPKFIDPITTRHLRLVELGVDTVLRLGTENKGLRADKDATESRLKLAQDEQKAVTSPVEILELNSTKLEARCLASRGSCRCLRLRGLARRYLAGAKVLAHSPSLNQTGWDLNSDYLERLLV
jgi:hypothetical protein